jgi:DNA-binding LytR/AlgR family response regulator
MNYPSQFYRCHRSFIINLTKLKLIDGHQALLENMKVPISKTTKAELITKMGKPIG